MSKKNNNNGLTSDGCIGFEMTFTFRTFSRRFSLIIARLIEQRFQLVEPSVNRISGRISPVALFSPPFLPNSLRGRHRLAAQGPAVGGAAEVHAPQCRGTLLLHHIQRPPQAPGPDGGDRRRGQEVGQRPGEDHQQHAEAEPTEAERAVSLMVVLEEGSTQ